MSYKTLGQTVGYGKRQASLWRALRALTVNRIHLQSFHMEHSPNDLSQSTEHVQASVSPFDSEGVEKIVRPTAADQTMTKMKLS